VIAFVGVKIAVKISRNRPPGLAYVAILTKENFAHDQKQEYGKKKKKKING
jgi:hypothetical protein